MRLSDESIVPVVDGVLGVKHLEFRKKDPVKVNMHGEKFNTILLSISPSGIIVKAKNGKKYKILIQRLEKDDVKFAKLEKINEIICFFIISSFIDIFIHLLPFLTIKIFIL